MSHGTAGSPILIKGNRFRGGGPSTGGGGILAGDEGSSYATVEDNILVDPGQYGIAIAGGNNNQLLRNKVYARQQPFTNVGLYVWNQYAPACYSHTVENNETYFVNKDGVLGPAWDAANCGVIAGWANNDWSASLTPAILPEQLLCPEIAAYYKFNNNWSDNTGSGLTITPSGAGFICDGNVFSTGFDGINDYLALPRSFWLKPASDQISVSCWIKPANVQGIKGIAHSQDGDGWNDGWRMLLLGDNINARVVTDRGAADIYCGGIEAGKWNHVVMTYDDKKLRGFVNGVLQGTVDIAGSIIYKSTTDLNMRIGICNGDYYFAGYIDEFKFYYGVLQVSDILQDYNTWKDNMNTPCILSALPAITGDDD